MSSLNKTPFQLLLIVLSLSFLAMMSLSLWQSYQASGQQAGRNTLASVEIPSAEMLAAPPVQQFRQMMSMPLFWEERRVPAVTKAPTRVPPVANVKPPTPINVIKPDGRLVGVIDLGDERFALVQGQEGEGSQHLRERERWQGWTVAAIETQKVVLEQAGQQHELLLISDFKAPTAGQALTTAQAQAAQATNNNAANQAKPAAPARKSSFMPAQATASMDPEQIKQMREARRKLLQARWGNAESPQKKKQ